VSGHSILVNYQTKQGLCCKGVQYRLPFVYFATVINNFVNFFPSFQVIFTNLMIKLDRSFKILPKAELLNIEHSLWHLIMAWGRLGGY
jgi:hypothetical protein